MANAIEKLRECTLMERGCVGYSSVDANELADEIEAAYMKLPVDADGVPIRPGDVLTSSSGTDTVAAVDEAGFCYFINDEIPNYTYAAHYTHKPETIEDILMDAMQWAFYMPYATRNLDAEDKVKEYAERIRKVVD